MYDMSLFFIILTANLLNLNDGQLNTENIQQCTNKFNIDKDIRKHTAAVVTGHTNLGYEYVRV